MTQVAGRVCSLGHRCQACKGTTEENCFMSVASTPLESALPVEIGTCLSKVKELAVAAPVYCGVRKVWHKLCGIGTINFSVVADAVAMAYENNNATDRVYRGASPKLSGFGTTVPKDSLQRCPRQSLQQHRKNLKSALQVPLDLPLGTSNLCPM